MIDAVGDGAQVTMMDGDVRDVKLGKFWQLTDCLVLCFRLGI